MKRFLLTSFILFLTGSVMIAAPRTSKKALTAKDILYRSIAAQAGSASVVKVSYKGKWKIFASTTQPVLTDTGFRKDSVEVYRPASGSVSQTHSGPDGKKVVKHRTGGSTSVGYNGKSNREKDIVDAAALVGDAYQLFLFGARYAGKYGRNFTLAGNEKIKGHACYIVAGDMPSGFGNSAGDFVRLSIDQETFVCRRVYFSINGLQSTRGAEVDTTMSNFVKAPNGSLWPTEFYERVRKPLTAPAHRWTASSLVIDGKRVK